MSAKTGNKGKYDKSLPIKKTLLKYGIWCIMEMLIYKN